MLIKNKNTAENKRTKELDKIEKYIDEEIINLNKSTNANNNCNCSNLNYVELPKNIDTIELLNYKKKSNKKSTFKKICENYKDTIIICIIILVFIIILIKKQNLMNQLKLMLIKYELLTKILKIKNYIFNKNQKDYFYFFYKKFISRNIISSQQSDINLVGVV